MSLFWIKRILVAMALADVAVFGSWVAREEAHRTGEWRKLPVEGYDPRDLISGHYVRFHLIAAREAEAIAPPAAKWIAVCLERSADGLYHVTRFRPPGDGCSPFLAGSRDASRLDFGIDRFYVDERIASEVQGLRAGADTYLLATIDSTGAIHPLDLVVNGNSLGSRR
jgi:hypothetical protein